MSEWKEAELSPEPVNVHGAESNRGGDLLLSPGKGWDGTPHPPIDLDGAIRFQDAQGNEVVRIESGGRVLVRGELVEDNRAVWQALAGWMRDAGIVLPEGWAR